MGGLVYFTRKSFMWFIHC